MVLTLRDREAIELDNGRGGVVLLRLDAVRSDNGYFRNGVANIVLEIPRGSRIKARVVEYSEAAGCHDVEARLKADAKFETLSRGSAPK